jgi:tetratricopeptide (TPR) repeat protein
MLPVNPYIAGNPVTGEEAFFGRTDVLRKVLSVLRSPNRNAITLYGQRRIGKTSILRELEQRLPKEGPYRAVYFDLQDKAAWSLHRVLFDLARTISSAIGIADPSLSSFEEDANFYRTQFLSLILSALGKEESIVLLFDEFDVLDNPKQDQAGFAFFPYLRQLMETTQRQQYVFVIGRKPEDLSNITLSIFKGVSSQRVSTLKKADAESVVRQSERNNTLSWSKSAVDKVWELTHGHPYMTQLLCSVIWDRAYEETPETETLPAIKTNQIEDAISETLEQGANAFQWIWGGLPPAERVVVAALAETGAEPVTQEVLEQILQRSGVRVIIRELELAPNTLIDWDLLEEIEDRTYRFRVELLRRWVVRNKPLARVKEELDRLDPLAEGLYQTGNAYFNSRQLDEAVDQLQRALAANPNHLKAKLLLGRIWLEQKKVSEAIQVLEDAYSYDEASARASLIQALFAQAGETTNEDDEVEVLERILQIQPNQLAAKRRLSGIWIRRGDSYLANEQFERALKAFTKTGDHDKIAEAQLAWRRYQLKSKETEAKKFEREEKWEEAAAVYHQLVEEFPDEGDWVFGLRHAEEQAELASFYLEASGAIKNNDMDRAGNLLAQIIAERWDYKDAAKQLLLAVSGTDVDELVKRLEDLEGEVSSLRGQQVIPELVSQMPISELALGDRISTALANEGVRTVGDVLDKLVEGEQALLEIYDIGSVSLQKILDSLALRGLLYLLMLRDDVDAGFFQSAIDDLAQRLRDLEKLESENRSLNRQLETERGRLRRLNQQLGTERSRLGRLKTLLSKGLASAVIPGEAKDILKRVK